jgi:hypothetical protein
MNNTFNNRLKYSESKINQFKIDNARLKKKINDKIFKIFSEAVIRFSFLCVLCIVVYTNTGQKFYTYKSLLKKHFVDDEQVKFKKKINSKITK